MPIVKKILRTLRGLQNSCTQQNNLKIVVPRGRSSGRSIPSYRWKSYGAPPKPPYKFEEEGGKEMLEEEEERRAPPRLNSASATARGRTMGTGLRMARGGRNKNRKQSIVLGISLL